MKRSRRPSLSQSNQPATRIQNPRLRLFPGPAATVATSRSGTKQCKRPSWCLSARATNFLLTRLPSLRVGGITSRQDAGPTSHKRSVGVDPWPTGCGSRQQGCSIAPACDPVETRTALFARREHERVDRSISVHNSTALRSLKSTRKLLSYAVAFVDLLAGRPVAVQSVV